MSHRSLDADAAIRRTPSVCVQDVHELGIASGQSALLVCVLKGGTSRIQTLEKNAFFKNLCGHSKLQTHDSDQKLRGEWGADCFVRDIYMEPKVCTRFDLVWTCLALEAQTTKQCEAATELI